MLDLRIDLFYLFFSIFLGACGQVFLKFATYRLGVIDFSWPGLLFSLIRIFTNPWIIVGTIFFVISMVIWIKVITLFELSRAYPSVGLSYVLVFLMSVFFFKESINWQKVAGIFLVSVGVYFLHC